MEVKFWAAKRSESKLLLQRSFWKPLRSMMEIFHVLPLASAVILFVLFATDGQFREIYISYLEGPIDGATTWVVSLLAALVAIGLISAVLYEAHNALSTTRLNVVHSSYSDPAADSNVRSLQRGAAFALAFVPWLGVTVGLFGARNYVAARYCQLLDVAHVRPDRLQQMQFLPHVSGVLIAAAVIILGVMTAFLVRIDDRMRVAQSAVACIVPALAALLFLLFTDGLNADASISLPTAVYAGVATVAYCWIYHRLYRRRGGFMLSRAFTSTGIAFRKRRRRLLALWAFLPWLLFALYFAFNQVFAPSALAANGCPGQVISTITVPAPGRWAIFPVAMCSTLAIGLMVANLLHRLGASVWRRRTTGFIVFGLAVAAISFSLFNDPQLIVLVYRFIGPLATVAIELLFLISTFAVLGLLSQNSGFPALTLIVLTMIVCVIFPRYAGLTAIALGLAYFSFAVVAFFSGRMMTGAMLLLLICAGWVNFTKFTAGPSIPQNSAPGEATITAAPSPDLSNVRTAYLCWLDQKGVPAARRADQLNCGGDTKHLSASHGKYPVLIVAAEGGGIYAASAAATFLAKLEDLQPGFTEHIFAISGVSGGAIGAAIFQALDHARHPDPGLPSQALATDDVQSDGEEICTRQTGEKVGQNLTEKIASIMQDDHFSPVVGSIFPEIFNARLKRPDALRASFEYSSSAQDAAAGLDLCARFGKHWSPASAAPALVLNSTWVEMGFRVAFAPFRLHDLDESLYSFLDPSMPNESCPLKNDPQSCVSLMTAAGVSARFPGIMPPFSVKVGGTHWNFVDGAYSDNSGATTALDLYEALKDVVSKDDVDLRVVLITSSSPQPNLEDQSINGTAFGDTVAPIDAIMKVREDLGNEAVARACSEIYRDEKQRGIHYRELNGGCVAHSGTDGALQIVEIQDQSYGLPLGWKISRTSFAVVSWMLGEPDACNLKNDEAQGQTPVQNEDDQNAQLTDTILQRNSCVSRLLVRLVKSSSGPETNGTTQ